ncbi:MAG: polyamine ABC transporter substrate-binding protein [Arenicella sp.]|nr:polyamine ABC transporter substrate-binding protein [Arenicella sp.]
MTFTRPMLTVSLVFASALSVASAKELHIYNWSDYIAEDTIANFEAETGIEVSYDVYDSNEVLETKLLAGRSGYDLVFPTARPFAARHLKANLYRTLDKDNVPDLTNLDPTILRSLVDLDPDNAHVVPYMWGTTGIGVNLEKVKAILGEDMPLDTWALIFDPKIVQKLSSCGVTLMDDPIEVFTAARSYLGKDASDYSKEAIDASVALIQSVRPFIRYFHSSQYISDLANGDTCVAHGYSGDMFQARDRAAEANNGMEIGYVVPKEGAVVWTDVMAIPADAENVEEAHQFINYMMQPEVIAAVTNYVSYANPNLKATSLVDPDISSDPGIYPAASTVESLIVLTVPTTAEARNINRNWTRIKTNQ